MSGALTIVADMAIVHMTASLLAGHKPSVSLALAAALKRWPVLVAVELIFLAAVALGMFACILPGVYLGLSFAIAAPICMMENKGPIESLRLSFRRMDGVRGTLFAANLVFGILGTISDAILALVEEAVWAMPFWVSLSETTWLVTSHFISITATIFVYSLAWIPARVLGTVVYFQTQSRPDATAVDAMDA